MLYGIFDIITNQVKNYLWLLLDYVEKLDRFWYGNLCFYGRFSFL